MDWVALAKRLYDWLIDQAITPPAGHGGVAVGGHVWLEPGNAVEVEQMNNVEHLRELCLEAVSNPGWIAHDITGDGKPETFCNRAAQFIAQGMGYFCFSANDSADMMIDKMAFDPDWEVVPLHLVAQEAAKGALIILGAESEPHGHVTVAAPEPPEDSGSWGESVPMVAHVGGGHTPNGIVKASAAFRMDQRPGLRAFMLTRSLA